MFYFLISIKKAWSKFAIFIAKNAKKNDRTFTLKIHRLYVKKIKKKGLTLCQTLFDFALHLLEWLFLFYSKM